MLKNIVLEEINKESKIFSEAFGVTPKEFAREVKSVVNKFSTVTELEKHIGINMEEMNEALKKNKTIIEAFIDLWKGKGKEQITFEQAIATAFVLNLLIIGRQVSLLFKNQASYQGTNT